MGLFQFIGELIGKAIVTFGPKPKIQDTVPPIVLDKVKEVMVLPPKRVEDFPKRDRENTGLRAHQGELYVASLEDNEKLPDCIAPSIGPKKRKKAAIKKVVAPKSKPAKKKGK